MENTETPHPTPTQDPRGPYRTVIAVESTPEAKECDHVACLTRHFTAPRIGEQVRCFHCGPWGAAS
jgi:hypothetical protein